MQITVRNGENEQAQALPIDFALVTVSPFVHNAILQYIEEYEIVQDDFASLTYYRGHITIPSTSEHYKVIAVLLSESEINDKSKDAETSITRMIKRWHPVYVVTIGIADGIAGKVQLGDIVIADVVYDYEPTKQTPGEEPKRSQQFPCDRLLYGRAFYYQSNEWQNDITLPWLNSSQESNLTSQEHANRDNITLPWLNSSQESNLTSQEHANRDNITLPWLNSSQESNLTPQEHTNRGDFTLPWPTATQTRDALPKKLFGAISSGKNVTSDPAVLSELQDECPTLLAIARDSAVVARACAQQLYPIPFLEIRSICDYANEQHNNYYAIAAQIVSAFSIYFLRSCPTPPLMRHMHRTEGPSQRFGRAETDPAARFRTDEPSSYGYPHSQTMLSQSMENTQIIKERKPLLLLCGQSLRHVTESEIMSSLSEEVKSRPIEIVRLDFTDLEVNGVMARPQLAVQRLTDPQGVLHESLKRSKEADFAFYGLMRIPLAFLIGRIIPATQPVRLFDIHPNPDPTLETWAWPSTGEPFPPLEVSGIPRRKNVAKRVVAIGVSISFTVSPAQMRASGLHDALIVELKLPNPKRGIIGSEEQVREYGRIFRDVLDLIIQRCPATKCIHVFYAGPMALAFHAGQQIAGDVHPPVVAWNFLPLRYDWGIDLGEAVFGNGCIVHPLGPTSLTQKTDEYYRYFGD